MKKSIRLLLFLPSIVLAGCASKSDLVLVSDDLNKLKTESETIKSQSAVSYADIQQVRDEIARQQGRVEEIAHNNEQMFGKFRFEDSLLVHKVDELDSRLFRIEQKLGLVSEKPGLEKPAQSAKDIQTQPVSPASTVMTDKSLLDDGIKKLSLNNAPGARGSFSLLIKNYPKSELVDDAQFYLAESYFNEKWYEKAVLEYQVVIAKYTKSNKRAVSLYKQGLAFELLGDAVNAKARFRDVVNIYPASAEAKLAKAKL
ncbi:MAG: tetratricopeptide repeat protein [Chlorobiaceae bacterium]|nr:tetratricopeptide repeat protein [Chlorobiaceae bacterium]